MLKDRPINNMNDSEFTINYQKEAEQAFNKYFSNENNEVIFLNGKWGSGKTSFLNVVLANKKGIKLKIIDLWRITGNHKPSDLIFKKIYPISFWCVKYISIILFILLSAISFYFLNTNNSEWSYPILLAGFLAGLNQIIGKVNYNDLFLTCLKLRSKITLFSKKKVVIIDDFDRIDEDKQTELYKIFNLLSNREKIQFVFLGDYTKIINSKTEYLQKIIDRRLELPYVISPSNIWSNYIDQLITEIDKKRSVTIQKLEKNNLKKLQTILISENRVLREKKMFEKYIDEILIETKSYDRVNLDQQLVIIYLYLFHTEKYNNLVNNIENILNLKPNFTYTSLKNESYSEENYLSSAKEKFTELIGFEEQENLSDERSDLIWEVLFKFEKYLNSDNGVDYAFNDFEIQFPHYLINYIPKNLTGHDIRELLKDSLELDDFINVIKQNSSDVFNFIRRNQEYLTNEEKEKLFNFSIDILRRDYDDGDTELSQIVSLSLSTKFYNPNNIEFIQRFEKITSKKLHLSQRLNIYYKYFHFNIPKMREFFYDKCKLLLYSEQFHNVIYPYFIISIVFDNIEDIDLETFNKIVAYSDKNFYGFLQFFGKYHMPEEKLKIEINNKKIKKIVMDRVNKMDESYDDIIEIS